MMADRPEGPRTGPTVVDDDTQQLVAVLNGLDVEPPTATRRRRHVRRALIGLMVGLVLLLGVVAVGLFAVSENLGNSVARVPNVFGRLDASTRPPASPVLTVLLVGTDSRADVPTTGTDADPGADPGSQRSDVLMLARIDPSRTGASVVSIPRDSWVDIPGRGMNKINAAYAFGGPSLLVQTVEGLTGVRVDHFAVVDFAGFTAMVDAVGGIDVQVAEATSNNGVDFAAGANHLDGAGALAYVRQRYDLPRGDLDRAQRQQNALRAVLEKAATGGMLADPVQLYRLLDATARSVSVDDTLTNGGLRELGISMRGMRPSAVEFLGAPVAGLGREGAQSVVHLDPVRSAQLWDALRSDRVDQYVLTNPTDQLAVNPP
jgi:LCP family protein required for cell wall assembly